MECLNELDKRNKFVSLSGIIKFDIHGRNNSKKKKIAPMRLGIVEFMSYLNSQNRIHLSMESTR